MNSDNAHHAWVFDGIREVPLTREARADLGVLRELRVQQLDRDPVLVAMCRLRANAPNLRSRRTALRAAEGFAGKRRAG